MSVYKEPKTNTWKVYYRYTDFRGRRHQTTKRGFATKKEALAWEREQLNRTGGNLDMTLASFVETYAVDMKNRLKENTWHTKEHIFRTKIVPYLGNRKMSEILPRDIIAWQNEMLKGKDKNGRPYSPVYLKTVNNQLSALFNHAVKFYGLKENPAAKVGNMGKSKNREMEFWTQEEYAKFAEEMMDNNIRNGGQEILIQKRFCKFYTKAVSWAVEHDITKGTGNGKFSPNATCTRAQIVTFLYRDMGE